MKKKTRIFLFIVGCFILFILMGSGVNAREYTLKHEKRILVICSYSESFISVPEETKGILSVLQSEDVEYDIEYMDAKRFETKINEENFYRSLKYKLNNINPYDAVIVADDAALQFAMDFQEELFQGMPIVFFGINDLNRAKEANENPWMTGIYEKSCVEDNIEMVSQMIPETKQIVAIVDGTITGVGDEQQFLEAQDAFQQLQLSTISSVNYTYDELKGKLQNLPENTAAFFFTLHMDQDGNYMELDDQFEYIKNNIKVPVFRVSIGGVGSGIVGGKMIDYEECGAQAARITMAVLNGDSISGMSLMEDTPYYYLFDYEMLVKFGIDLNQIPAGATVINRPLTFSEKYSQYFIYLLIFSTFAIVLSLIVVRDNFKKRKVQKALLINNEELRQTYEELSASEEEIKTQYGIIEKQTKEVHNLYQKYEAAIYSTDCAVWELNLVEGIMYISPNFETLFGSVVPLNGKINTIFEKLTDEKNGQEIRRSIQMHMEGKLEEINLTIPIIDKNLNKRWILIRGKGALDENKSLNHIYGIFMDVTEAKEREEYIEHYAKYDFLTGMPNRLDFEKTLNEELHAGRAGALMLLDLDNFKGINDTLGHSFGDEILKQVANRFSEICDQHFYAARMGGDEFLLLLRDVKNQHQIMDCLKVIKNKISEVYSLDGINEYINYSMGITFYPQDSNNLNQLMINADAAMYKVKQNGKNNYAFYYDDMQQKIKERKEIEDIIRISTKEKKFELYYQPQVDMETGEIVGVEALVRLREYGIGPDVFIPIAEDTGDIVEIGRWVTKQAISQMAKWKKKGLPEKIMAINYSVKQLRDKGFLHYLQDLLEEYDISPSKIEIEVTEGIFMENTIETKIFLEKVKKAGINLSLDDFGAGYSSLSYLTFVPVNKLKLDKSINDKFLEFKDTKVMESIIALAHGLDLKITAEGIEDMSKFLKLKKCSCDFCQGYLFSKPKKADEIEKIYNKVFTV